MKISLCSENHKMMDKLHNILTNTINNQFEYNIITLPGLSFTDTFPHVKESGSDIMLACMNTHLSVKDLFDYCRLFNTPLLIITEEVNYRDKTLSHYFSVNIMSWTELKRKLFFWLTFNDRKENRNKIKKDRGELSLLTLDDVYVHVRNRLKVNLSQCNLTHKEKQIASLLTYGLDCHQISHYLHVNQSAIYFHIKKMKKKLNIDDKNNLMLFFNELNMKSVAGGIRRGDVV